jgi:hypothetical protein
MSNQVDFFLSTLHCRFILTGVLFTEVGRPGRSYDGSVSDRDLMADLPVGLGYQDKHRTAQISCLPLSLTI